MINALDRLLSTLREHNIEPIDFFMAVTVLVIFGLFSMLIITEMLKGVLT